MVNVCFDRVTGLLHCKGEWLKTKNKKEKKILVNPRENGAFYHRLKMFNRQQTICVEQL